MSKIIGWIIVILVVIGLGVWVSKSSKTEPAIAPATSIEPIKIGYVGPFTGPVAGTSGEDVGNGWKLAVADRPEIAGRKVEVIYEDDACDPAKAVSAAQKLISVDKVKVLVNGVCSGSMVAMGPVAEQAKVVLFTPVSTSPKITDLGDYAFRTSGSAGQTAKAMLDFLVAKKYQKVGLLYENAEYTVGIKDALQAQGFSPVVTEAFNSKEADLRTHLLKVSQASPDMLVLVTNSTVTGVAAIKQLRELKIALPILANEYFAFSTIVEDPNAEGVFATQYKYDDRAANFVGFINKYQSTYGKMPSQNIYAVLPYDGYNVLANAIEQCKSDDPDCVRNELYKIKSYNGLTGVITIDQNGDTAREFVIRQIKNKQLVNAQ